MSPSLQKICWNLSGGITKHGGVVPKFQYWGTGGGGGLQEEEFKVSPVYTARHYKNMHGSQCIWMPV